MLEVLLSRQPNSIGLLRGAPEFSPDSHRGSGYRDNLGSEPWHHNWDTIG